MKFGEYIRRRRKELDLKQTEMEGFGQTYISDMEIGKSRPVKKKTITELVRVLKLPTDQVDWLWMYSLLNYDPREYFRREHGARHVNENSAAYGGRPSKKITIGTPEPDVRAVLGLPDFEVAAGDKTKLCFAKERLLIMLNGGKVSDIEFT
jgi:transcriptional regulator with XRE-family HTH domain